MRDSKHWNTSKSRRKKGKRRDHI